MQVQIECNSFPLQQQSCLICNQLFEMTEAKIIICDDQGNDHGEVCFTCLEKRFYWLNYQFEQLKQSKSAVEIRQTRSLEIPISA